MQHHHQHEHYHQQHQKKHNITTPQQTPKGERERGKSVALIHNKTNQNKKQQNEEKKKRMPERARARLGRLGRKRNKFFWIFFVFVCCGGVEEKEKMNHKRMQPLNLTIGSKVGALKLFEDKDSHHPRSALVAVGTREEEMNQVYVYRINVKEEDYQGKVDNIYLCHSYSYEEGGDIISLSWLGDNFSNGKLLAASSNGGVYLHKKLEVNHAPTDMEVPDMDRDKLFDYGGQLSCVSTFKTGARSVTVATGGVDTSLKLWDLERGAETHHFPYVDPIAIRNIAFLWDNNQFCTVGTALKAWDLRVPTGQAPPPLFFEHLPVLDDIKRSYHHPSSSSSFYPSSSFPSSSPSPARGGTPFQYMNTPGGGARSLLGPSSSFPSSSSSSSSSSFTSPSPTPALTCVAANPTNKNMVLTGDEEGNVIGWDIRRQKYPVFWSQQSNSPIWDIKFHPTYPRTFYTSSENGTLTAYDLKEGGRMGGGIGIEGGMGGGEGFPRMGNCVSQVVSQNALPLNCLDCWRKDEGLGIVVGGGEGETLVFQFELRG